ncbi:protein FAM200C-like [Oratosquilla oratoria]|uniref:protein FAM200C-like n=1 Tax=Oratosquilla oratoria TaxID=337810 RepID=UPI003F75DC54
MIWLRASRTKLFRRFKGHSFFFDSTRRIDRCCQSVPALVFVRYTTEKGIAEEFLFCKPLQTTTKAQDVMGLINDFFEGSNISWESLVGVCTDGAPARLGSRSVFVTLVKQKNPAVESTHCLIHKEVLASRTLPKNFKQHLETVINDVNFTKGSALSTRLFRRLCEGMGADHESLLFHTQVRWLSKGNMLQRVLELFDEVVAFLRAQENVVLLEALEDEFFRVRLSYLSDIFSALNELNRKLQGKGTNILFQSDKIRAFVAKLELWKKRAGSGSFSSFLALNECVEDMEDGLPDPIAEDIKQHLEGLEEEFKYYFPGIKNESNENKLIRDPFQRNVDVPDAWQEEFLDLKNDSPAKDAFQNMELEEFWTQVRGTYPLLATNALRILVQFSSTYLCETGFSALVHLKTKARNKLEVEADLRCALSITPPDIEGLVIGKQCQKSH